jgi:hypothetical protein
MVVLLAPASFKKANSYLFVQNPFPQNMSSLLREKEVVLQHDVCNLEKNARKDFELTKAS